MIQGNFNKEFRHRTRTLAISVVNFIDSIQLRKSSLYIISKQLVRCSTSVGANFRAVCLARSTRERFAKLCIVTEEADEVIYWLEILEGTNENLNLPPDIKQEALEISKVMASYRRRVGQKLKQNNS